MTKPAETALRCVLNAYALTSTPDAATRAKPELARYLETLAAAGQTDPDRLTVYGFAFLRRDLHLGQGYSGL